MNKKAVKIVLNFYYLFLYGLSILLSFLNKIAQFIEKTADKIIDKTLIYKSDNDSYMHEEKKLSRKQRNKKKVYDVYKYENIYFVNFRK
ncbi:MAG: hypothetical protein ACPLRZ_11445 [Thermovenabulum sp.]|uniref:hypothetical protein n=1 Tax=Thermovenabulum sp. TaxID=3100335 RepID=UPI003C7C107D